MDNKYKDAQRQIDSSKMILEAATTSMNASKDAANMMLDDLIEKNPKKSSLILEMKSDLNEMFEPLKTGGDFNVVEMLKKIESLQMKIKDIDNE